MVKIDRTETAPASLAIESQKSHGSYNLPDVMTQLKADFHDKCYICELKELTDVEVEHLLPHYNRRIKERVFDWNNLFYTCPHCNSIKNKRKYDEKILNCCTTDPETLLEHIYLDKAVIVKPMEGNTDEKVMLTAELIQSSFQLSDTGTRDIQSDARYKQLAKTMNGLYRALENFKKDPTSKKYLAALRAKLKREYQFAAFTRHYVRSHLEDYPELEEFVS